MRYCERLRELRLARGLSEARLAKLAGVPFGTLHNYGMGIRLPTFAAAIRIARALGTDCRAFEDCSDLQGEPVPPPGPPPQRGRPRKILGPIPAPEPVPVPEPRRPGRPPKRKAQ